MCVVSGRNPVSRLKREGAQNDTWQWFAVNRVPRDARRSMFGDLIHDAP
jgi:hypothetical protein